MKHRNTNKLLAIVAGSLLATTGMAQETRNLSLDEAIRMSLQNSGQLKISRAKIDEATAVLREAKDNRLPNASVSGSYLRVANPTVDLKVKLGGSSSSGTETQTKSSSISVDQAAYGIANVSLPLFSGLKIHYGIESAKYLAEAVKLDAETDKEEVIQNTINAYSNLYKAQAARDLVKQNLKQSEQRVTDFSNLEQNGLMARNDLLKAQLQKSNIDLTLLDAENNYKLATINMDLLLGLSENTDLVPDSSSFTLGDDAGTLTDWESKAFQNRNDIAALRSREKAAAANVKAIKGDYYPSLALTGGYIAADIPNLITIYNALNGGIGLQYNLSSLWKTGAKVAQARARETQIIANRSLLSDAIRLQISQAYQNYLLSKKKIEVYNQAIEQANENYRITKNKYDNSLVTTTDLLEADVAQLQAKLNYANAKADAAVAYRKLQQTAGMLTEPAKATTELQ